MEEKRLSIGEWDKRQAVENFNAVWELVEKESRTKEEDLLMIHTAHAPRFHWGKRPASPGENG